MESPPLPPIPRPSSPEESRRPVDAHTGQPLPQRAQPGYYPGYSTLAQKDFWDEATRTVVMARVENVPPIRFFSNQEAALMAAVADRLLPQNDRDSDHRIPIVNYIDERLYTGRSDGYRYDDMPPDDEAFRLGLQGIDAVATHLYDRAFVELDQRQQDTVLKSLHDYDPPAGQEIWRRLPITRFWLLLLGDVVEGYYAHPYAWDEVGFGGPAYPRGYMRLENGKREPWEVDEQRYDWAAPPEALSDEYVALQGPHAGHPPPGQEGTH